MSPQKWRQHKVVTNTMALWAWARQKRPVGSQFTSLRVRFLVCPIRTIRATVGDTGVEGYEVPSTGTRQRLSYGGGPFLLLPRLGSQWWTQFQWTLWSVTFSRPLRACPQQQQQQHGEGQRAKQRRFQNKLADYSRYCQ